VKKPLLQNEALLADVKEARQRRNGFHLWWLGQSGFLVQWQNQHLLLDPYLSDSLTKKYAATDKPHVRMTERVIAPERLDFIDVVTSSHNHTDHLDAETLLSLFQVNPELQIVIPEANRNFVAERLAIDARKPIGLDDGTMAEIGGFKFTGVAAAHEMIELDDAARCKFLGYVIQFGPWSIYHSGDCVSYAGLRERLRNFSIDVALLPINGRAAERGVAGNFSGEEAAGLAKDIGAKLVIPCHYEMFEFNTVSPDGFEKSAKLLGQPYCVLRAGERWSSGSSRV
jgi:L-ascorbate metabolism protein UlaG (beta-lactamase superfamily)